MNTNAFTLDSYPMPPKLMGRPKVYVGEVLTYIATLIQTHNVARAMRILRAPAGSAEAASRNLDVVPLPLTISQPTLLKIARDAGISLKAGRPCL